MNNNLSHNARHDDKSNSFRCPVLVLFGPTACGKTDILFRLFAADNAPLCGMAEVISADSMQVYKGLDIGTAKPVQAMLRALPHHLIDVISPREQFSAGDFVREADKLCLDIASRGKLPVVAGGTGFYIRNFLLGLPKTPQGGTETRKRIKERIKTEGAEKLHAELAALDAVSAERIHVNDEYRITRALEVCLDSGTALSEFSLPLALRTSPSGTDFSGRTARYDFLTVIITREREELYARIDARVDAMFNAGLESEVSRLIESGLTQDDYGMRAIGYREFFAQLPASLLPPGSARNEETVRFFKTLIARNTKRYAKRQQTYMKGIPGARIINADDFAALEKIVREFLPQMQHG